MKNSGKINRKGDVFPKIAADKMDNPSRRSPRYLMIGFQVLSIESSFLFYYIDLFVYSEASQIPAELLRFLSVTASSTAYRHS